MDEDILSSLSSYLSLEEQKKASRLFKNHRKHQRQLSLESNTYVHFVVPIRDHWAAVQITIWPFRLPQFPAQVLFSPRVRYAPCCRDSFNSFTSGSVIESVQQIIAVFYGPVGWKISSNECLVDHPSVTDHELTSCDLTIRSRLKVYEEWAAHHGALPSPPTLFQDLGQPTRQNEEHENEANGARFVDSIVTSNKKRRLNEEDSDMPTDVQRHIQNISKLLMSSLRSGTVKGFSNNTLPSVSGNVTPAAYEIYLHQYANVLKTDSNMILWAMRFMGSCCFLVTRPTQKYYEKTSPTSPSLATLQNWRNFVQIVNGIVNGLLPRWHEKAHCIYHFLAEKNTLWSKASRLCQDKRDDIVKGVVTALADYAPSPAGVVLFNPAVLVSGLLRIDFPKACTTLGLSFADTTTKESFLQWDVEKTQFYKCISVQNANNTLATISTKDSRGSNWPSNSLIDSDDIHLMEAPVSLGNNLESDKLDFGTSWDSTFNIQDLVTSQEILGFGINWDSNFDLPFNANNPSRTGLETDTVLYQDISGIGPVSGTSSSGCDVYIP